MTRFGAAGPAIESVHTRTIALDIVEAQPIIGV